MTKQILIKIEATVKNGKLEAFSLVITDLIKLCHIFLFKDGISMIVPRESLPQA